MNSLHFNKTPCVITLFHFLLISTTLLEKKSEAFSGNSDQQLAKFTHPILIEATPFSYMAITALPETSLWVQTAFLHLKYSIGRANYEQISSKLSGGFTFSPKILPQLVSGFTFTPIQLAFLHTVVPPAIAEWKKYVDLGEFNIFAGYLALKKNFKSSAILLTPYLRVHLPTDTSRFKEARKVPIKTILGPQICNHPYFLIEPGASSSIIVGPANFYVSTGFGFGSIGKDNFLFLWNFTFGGAAGFSFLKIIAETGGTIFKQENYDSVSWHVSTGLRFIHKKFHHELSARFGLSPDKDFMYGKFTIGYGLKWIKTMNQ